MGWKLASPPEERVERLWLAKGGMVISTLRLVPSPQRRAEVLEILRSIAGPAESQPGCLGCHLYHEDGPEGATVFCELWESAATLEEHIRSDPYLRLLAACEFSSLPPELCFHHVARTQGMELVHRLRGDRGHSVGA